MLVQNRPSFPNAVIARAAQPAPSDPSDVDLVNLDSPQKVALLPVMNPITMLRMVETAAQARAAGYVLDATLTGTYGESTAVDVTHQMHDLKKPEIPGQGTLGGTELKELYHFVHGQGMFIDGTVGKAEEHLLYAQAEDGKVHLDGRIGAFDVHETLVQIGTDETPVLQVSGSIGDQPLTLTVTTRPSDDPKVQATQHVEGTLGTAPMSYDEVVTSTNPNNLLGSGSGNFAGTPVALKQYLVLTAANTLPSPGPTATI